MRALLDHELPLHDPDLAVDVLDLIKTILRDSTAALERFKTQWKRDGPKLGATLKAKVPLVRPATPTQASETANPDAPGPVEHGTISTGATS